MTYDIPGDVQVEVNGLDLKISGDGKVNERIFKAKHVEIKKDDGTLTVFTKSPKKVDRADVGTVMGHIKNMVLGIENGVEYKMKIIYSHFPMNVKIEGDKISVENYLGEKNPRVLKIIENVQVKLNGQDITLTGHNKESVSLCAAQLEQLCRPRNKDKRVFQDGIYITVKNGKPVKK